ncbi:MAG: head GIN domain-containing protein [Candidatus Methylophosphatis roskildensis]
MNRRRLLQVCLGLTAARFVSREADAADVVRQERPVAAFDRLIVHGVFDVAITQGAREQLSVTAEPRLMPNIVTRVERRTLIIETSGSLKTDKTLRIDLTVRELQHLEADGSSSIRIDRLRAGALDLELSGSADLKAARLTLDTLKLRLAGSATVELGGSTGSQTVQINGSADYRGEGLDSASARVAASGSANATLRVRENLDADVSGSADLTYFGNPKVRKSVSDAASLERG